MVDSLLSSSYGETHVHKLLKSNTLKGTELTLQNCKPKEDLYRRENYHVKIRRYNSGCLEWTLFTGLIGQEMLSRVPNFMDPASQKQDEDRPGDLVSAVVGQFCIFFHPSNVAQVHRDNQTKASTLRILGPQ